MFKVAAGFLTVGALLSAAPAWSQRQEIDNDMSRCRTSASQPAVLVDVRGFAAEAGNVRIQSYPATREAWLTKGAWLNRIEKPVRLSGDHMRFCLPLPEPGRYGIAVRHDRDGNGKTDIRRDGGGFSNNPAISIFNLGKPSVEKTAFVAGSGVTRITINLRYM